MTIAFSEVKKNEKNCLSKLDEKLKIDNDHARWFLVAKDLCDNKSPTEKNMKKSCEKEFFGKESKVEPIIISSKLKKLN